MLAAVALAVAVGPRRFHLRAGGGRRRPAFDRDHARGTGALPAACTGPLLVSGGSSGTWVVNVDGSKRRLGNYTFAACRRTLCM